MLGCARVLYFGDQTSRYVARFCLSSVTKLHVTLRASVFLWRIILHVALHASVDLR
jgi:hypothetical protein